MYNSAGQSRQVSEDKALRHMDAATAISSLQTAISGDTIIAEGLEDILKAAKTSREAL